VTVESRRDATVQDEDGKAYFTMAVFLIAGGLFTGLGEFGMRARQSEGA
jgi:hypothetical protein